MRFERIVVAIFGLAAIALALAMPLSAQSGPIVAKGLRVALVIPPGAFYTTYGYDKQKVVATVARVDTAITVEGERWWHSAGYAPETSVKIADIRAAKGGMVEVRLERKRHPDVYLTVASQDTAFVFQRIFAPPGDSLSVQSEIAAAVEGRLFRNSPSVSNTTIARLLAIVDSVAHEWSIVDSLKGIPYLKVHAPLSRVVYNTNQTSVPERQAGTLNEVAFPIIRLFGRVDSLLPPTIGFMVVVTINSKSFAGSYAWLNETHHDDMVLYVPADVAARFANADITSQELIDRSIVMSNGNRIKVDLTK